MTEQELNRTRAQAPDPAPAEDPGVQKAADAHLDAADPVAPPAESPPGKDKRKTRDPESLRADIEMLRDVELSVTAELGRTKMTIGEITNLTGGSVVTLSKNAGDPADLRINDQLFASGEVIVMDGYFAIKITKLLSKEERVKNFL